MQSIDEISEEIKRLLIEGARSQARANECMRVVWASRDRITMLQRQLEDCYRQEHEEK